MAAARSFTASLSAEDLSRLVGRQLDSIVPELIPLRDNLLPFVRHALERMEWCCVQFAQKYYGECGVAGFDHRHTDHYAMFLYFLSNTLHRLDGSPELAARTYALNKALHAVDVYFEVELPEVFLLQHPVGTVLGRARYADFLLVYQRVSVGANLDGDSPVFGEGVVLFGGSTVIGRSQIGSNAWLSVGSVVMNEDVPPDSVVFGASPSLTIRPTSRDVARDLFGRTR